MTFIVFLLQREPEVYETEYRIVPGILVRVSDLKSRTIRP